MPACCMAWNICCVADGPTPCSCCTARLGGVSCEVALHRACQQYKSLLQPDPQARSQLVQPHLVLCFDAKHCDPFGCQGQLHAERVMEMLWAKSSNHLKLP